MVSLCEAGGGAEESSRPNRVVRPHGRCPTGGSSGCWLLRGWTVTRVRMATRHFPAFLQGSEAPAGPGVHSPCGLPQMRVSQAQKVPASLHPVHSTVAVGTGVRFLLQRCLPVPVTNPPSPTWPSLGIDHGVSARKSWMKPPLGRHQRHTAARPAPAVPETTPATARTRLRAEWRFLPQNCCLLQGPFEVKYAYCKI